MIFRARHEFTDRCGGNTVNWFTHAFRIFALSVAALAVGVVCCRAPGAPGPQNRTAVAEAAESAPAVPATPPGGDGFSWG